MHPTTVKSVDEFTRQCLRGLQKVKDQSSVLRKMGRALNEGLAPSVQVAGIALTLQPTAALGFDVLETVLDELYREHQKSPVVVFWDEFQEVLKLKDADTVLGRFRGSVQQQSGMAHPFAGSMRALNRYVAQAVLVKRGPKYFFSNPFSPLAGRSSEGARGSGVDRVRSPALKQRFLQGSIP